MRWNHWAAAGVLALGLGLILLRLASSTEHQAANLNDVRAEQFFLPGTNTLGMSVHGSATAMALNLPRGEVIATGGYKVAVQYAHPSGLVVSLTNTEMPVAGTSTTASGTGVLYHTAPTAGRILAISIGARQAITAAAVHVAASVNGTRISAPTAVIGAGLAQTQYALGTAASENAAVRFPARARIGCMVTSDGALAPVNASNELVCSVIVRY